MTEKTEKPIVNIAGQKLKEDGLYDTGRKKIVVDFRLVEKLCSIHCTQDEIAAVVGVHRDTLNRRIKDAYDMSFTEYYKIASSKGKASLRRKQHEVALAGNVQMLKFLGINELGQVEKSRENVVEKKIYINEATELSDEEINKELKEMRDKRDKRTDYGLNEK